MHVKFVFLRYQPDLMKDEWLPLGIVAESPTVEGTEIGVLCLESVSIEGGSELASAMLEDAPAILRQEVEQTRARLRPSQDFLEVLRAGSPWNFHFSAPEQEELDSEGIQEATWELYRRHVLRRPGKVRTKGRPSTAIHPRRMEAYEVAV